MARILKDMLLTGHSAFEIAIELSLPHDFISEIMHEYTDIRTYGDLIEVLELYFTDEIRAMKREN